LKEPEETKITNKNSATKRKRMKRDHEKAIHQELVGEIRQIQGKMDVLTQLYLDTSKDIQRLAINTKEGLEQDWETLLYHEENKEKESCNDIGTKSTKANE
jgi:hypothetical protein